ncbi:Rpn family recombination-promoting nuclease/putative transposase [Fodinicurvata sp. EGI_FJ10296]|uniref:Rpn family recombination-promoting nuclease/putative transposase n=1 Tax=Fodinicurvata sp. EGI_FJ10296 TaxID=3231908 RepID=UPI00345507CB
MAAPASNPHDSLFRALLDDPGRAAVVVREFLPPAIASLITPEPPRLIDGSFIDETLADSQSDRLFEVKLTSGGTAFVYVLMEHKSSLDARTPLQLLSYMVRIWDRFAGSRRDRLRALPPILPIVVYHGRRRWTVADTLLDCVDTGGNSAIADYVRALRYEVHDLGRREDDRLSASPEVAAVWLALKYVSHSNAPPEAIIRVMARLSDGTLLAQQIVRYILDRQQWIDADHWKQFAAEAKPGMEDSMVSLAAQEWLKQGKAEGMAEGKAEGLRSARRDDLLDILEARFGLVDQSFRERINAMSADDLRPLLRRAATAPTIADVLDGVSSH